MHAIFIMCALECMLAWIPRQCIHSEKKNTNTMRVYVQYFIFDVIQCWCICFQPFLLPVPFYPFEIL